MCIRKKGTGYDPVDAVKQAATVCGWTIPQVFSAAAQFDNNARSFDVTAEAAKFQDRNGSNYEPPRQVEKFANWVLIQAPEQVLSKLKNRAIQFA